MAKPTWPPCSADANCWDENELWQSREVKNKKCWSVHASVDGSTFVRMVNGITRNDAVRFVELLLIDPQYTKVMVERTSKYEWYQANVGEPNVPETDN